MSKKVDLLLELFKGREDLYAVKWISKGKKGFSPACRNKGKPFCKHKCCKCSKAAYIPYGEHCVGTHLKGGQTIGVYPLLKNNTSWFAAVDFDGKVGDPFKDAQALMEVCAIQELDVYLERSQSGNGYHVWCFFEKPIPAWKTRAVLFALLQEAELVEDGTKLPNSLDRLFPNQDRLSGKGFGNLIALPLQGPDKVQEGKSVFLNSDGSLCSDQFAFLSAVKRISEKQIDDLVEEWKIEEPVFEESTAKEQAPQIGKLAHLEKLSDCAFVTFCKDFPHDVTEPFWFSLATVLVPFEGGREAFHAWSNGYKGYSKKATDAKFDNAIKSVETGVAPHTCQTIKDEGFKGCPENGCNVKSPVSLARGFSPYWEYQDSYWMKRSIKGRGECTVKISNFIIKLLEEVEVSDGQEKKRLLKGDIICGGRKQPFEIEAKNLFNNGKLQEAIGEQGGLSMQFSPYDLNHIRLAAQTLSVVQRKNILIQFGWRDGDTYAAPSVVIKKEGIIEDSPEAVDLSSTENSRFLDLIKLSDKEFKDVSTHILRDFMALYPNEVMYPLIGHIFLAPVTRFLSDRTRYVLWLQGITGSGKSFVSKLAQCFYGPFLDDSAFTSWTSTMNFVQMVGYYFKDAVFLVDDFKKGNIRNSYELIQKLQTYADGTGRGRLNADSTTKTTRPIQGLMMSSGEDLPELEASILSRMIVLDCVNLKKNIPAGINCQKYRGKYSGITARYIWWLLNFVLKDGKGEEVEALVNSHMASFYTGIEGQQNDIRIAHNMALNFTGFYLFTRFFEDQKLLTHEAGNEMREVCFNILLARRTSQLRAVKDEQGSHIFISSLTALLASGRVLVHSNELTTYVGQSTYVPPPEDMKSVIVGFCKPCDKEHVYLYPQMAYAEVQKLLLSSGGGLLKLSRAAIGQQLADEGVLIPGSSGLAVFVWYRGKSSRVWKFPKEALGFFEKETEMVNA